MSSEVGFFVGRGVTISSVDWIELGLARFDSTNLSYLSRWFIYLFVSSSAFYTSSPLRILAMVSSSGAALGRPMVSLCRPCCLA